MRSILLLILLGVPMGRPQQPPPPPPGGGGPEGPGGPTEQGADRVRPGGGPGPGRGMGPRPGEGGPGRPGEGGGGPPRRAIGNPMFGPGRNRPGPDGPEVDRLAGQINQGRKLASEGRCGEAMRLLVPAVGSLPFGPDAAITAASCARKMGWLEDAIWLGLYAVDIDLFHVRAATSVALDLATWGDRAAAELQLERIDGVSTGVEPALHAWANLALRDGDIDELDILLRGWDAGGPNARELRRIQGRSWLDLDDPVSALAALAQTDKGAPTAEEVALRAEAARRSGDPLTAMELLAATGVTEADPAVLDAVRARVLVDDHHLEDAKRVMAPWVASDDEEVIASLWYLARASAEPKVMADHAHLYEKAKTSPLRVLEQLIPITQRKDAPAEEAAPAGAEG